MVDVDHSSRSRKMKRAPPGTLSSLNQRGSKGSTGPPAVHLPKHLYAMFDPAVAGDASTTSAAERFWPKKRRRVATRLSGVAAFALSSSSKENPETSHGEPVEEGAKVVPTLEELAREHKRKRASESALKVQLRLGTWDPHDPKTKAAAEGLITKEAFNTLFVGRLAETTTDAGLRAFAERLAAGRNSNTSSPSSITHVRVVRDSVTSKSKRYGFVEFAVDSDMTRAVKEWRNATAAKDADPSLTTLDGSKVVVDVERGRTVPSWVPKRFGGGGPASQVGGAQTKPPLQGGIPPPPSSSSQAVGFTASTSRRAR